ncbi:MAG: IS66 family insertion sequence element accessory protein TnpB [Magnetococcales bacterium]|nr:IS66 family insertion sequence element accessory protein TnpB [Magnetococcales bacterium]
MDSSYHPLQLTRQFPTLQRLEKERFHWLKVSIHTVTTITGQQLNWLLSGYNLNAMKPHKKLNYSSIL